MIPCRFHADSMPSDRQGMCILEAGELCRDGLCRIDGAGAGECSVMT